MRENFFRYNVVVKYKKPQWLIGIDEAGRGPLAGPVAVGGILVPAGFDFSVFSVVADSKKLSPKTRERVFGEVQRAAKKGDLKFHVALISEKIIDAKGISFAIRKGIAEVLEMLTSEALECVYKSSDTRRIGAKTRAVLVRTVSGLSDAGNEVAEDFRRTLVEVRLDGSLHAPKEYLFQKTIIKGDVTEPAISLASIMAKVMRDRKMIVLGKKYPVYRFEIHKGYGTKIHREAIAHHGLSAVHRKSFCKKWC